MSRSSVQSRKLALTFAICSLGAVSAQSGAATACPPGSHGVAPHCEPNQTQPHQLSATHSAQSQPGGLTEHRSSAAQTHGIIFVGGKSAINSQPVPPGHSPDLGSINSQPVPPGHAVHPSPRPGTPIERVRKPEAKQDDGGH